MSGALLETADSGTAGGERGFIGRIWRGARE
jgi:hypothetical protein